MMKKYLLILSLLIVILLAAAFAYFGNLTAWIAKLPNVPALSQENQKELDELDTLSWKNYTDSLGTFSLKYPDTWTYQSSDFHVSFKKENSSEPFMTIVYDKGEMEKIFTENPQSFFVEDLTIGPNDFTKTLMTPTLLESEVSHNYILRVGGDDAYINLKITSKKSASKDPVVRLLLGSIRTNPDKVTEALQTLKFKELDAQAKAAISNLRAQAELYYDTNKESYAKMCSSDTYFKKFLSTISAGEAYCNSSATEYVLSAKIPSGETMCIDSTSFSGTIQQPAQKLACEQPAPVESQENNFPVITE